MKNQILATSLKRDLVILLNSLQAKKLRVSLIQIFGY